MSVNILVVDDSSLTRKAIKRIIRMTGMDVGTILEADNGVKALKVLGDSEIDLVLSDLNMPEMCGSEMIAKMKANEATRSIPVVVVTTESQTTRIRDLLAEGVKDYLHKPFTPEEFRDVMQTIWTESSNEPNEVLTKVISQALETMAFLTVIPEDEDMVTPKNMVLTEIGFTGSKNGSIQILSDMNFGRTLAENMGGQANVDDESAFDALRELANVTCGLFLPIVVSSTAELFDVTVPSVKNDDDTPLWCEFTKEKYSFVLNIEGYAIAIKMTME